MRKAFVLILLVLTACAARHGLTVLRVIDGDTLVVRQDGEEIKVRLIGINAPEHDECYGPEAASALRGMVDGKTVTLVTGRESMDEYGRTLAYVYADGRFLNLDLAVAGFALARPYAPNTAHQPELADAMQRARDAQRGMWSPTACGAETSMSVDIVAVDYDPAGPDGDHLNEETVTLANTLQAPVDLSGWIIRDGSSSNRFTIPSGVQLPPGGSMTVHTGCGPNSTTDLYWCSNGPVWSNGGDIAILYDESGALVASFAYAPS